MGCVVEIRGDKKVAVGVVCVNTESVGVQDTEDMLECLLAEASKYQDEGYEVILMGISMQE